MHHSSAGKGQKEKTWQKTIAANAGLAGLQPGQQLTVIAWLWARTVKSPNPAFSHVDVPLASTFILSSKAGKESLGGCRWWKATATASRCAPARRRPRPRAAPSWRASAPLSRCLMSGAPIELQIHPRPKVRPGRMGDG
jgi:putative DNA methylase